MSSVEAQLKKFNRKVRFHEATNKYIVEAVRKGLDWLEKRAQAIDDWQDQIVLSHHASIQAIQEQSEREIERLNNQIAETKANAQDSSDAVSDALNRAVARAGDARTKLNTEKSKVNLAPISSTDD